MYKKYTYSPFTLQKQAHRKRNQIVVTRGRGKGSIMKVVKRYHIAVITKISTRNVGTTWQI